MAATVLTAVLSADVDSFLRGINAAATRLETFGRKAQDIGQTLSVAISVPLAALATKAVESATKMDSLTRGLTAVMGSSALAGQELSKLKEVAKLPGLGFQEAIQGSIRLQAAGFSAKLSREALMGFGNALATVGKGKADLDGVIMALGQIASKGKISAEEINQIAERVPQIRKIMESAFGTSNTEVLQKMGISSTAFIEKITAELGKLPKVTGGIQNSFENLSDATFVAFSKIGDSIIRTTGLSELLNSLSEKITAIGDKFSTLSPFVQTVIIAVTGLVAVLPVLALAMGVFITTVLPALTSGFIALNTTMGAVGLAITGLAILYAVLKSESNAAASVQAIQNQALQDAKDQLKGADETTGEYIDALIALQRESLKAALMQAELEAATLSFVDVMKENFLGLFDGKENNIDQRLKDLQNVKNDKVKLLAEAYNNLGKAIPDKKVEKEKLPGPSDADLKKAQKAREEYAKTIADSVERTKNNEIAVIRDVSDKKLAQLEKERADAIAFADANVKNEIQKLNEILSINRKFYAEKRKLMETDTPDSISTRSTGGNAQTFGKNDQFGGGVGEKGEEGFQKTLDSASGALSGKFIGQLDKNNKEFEKRKDKAIQIGLDMGAGLAGAFDSVGEALATGKNPFEAFGKSILKGFGDVLSKMGQAMIQQAAALVAVSIATGGALSGVAVRTGLAGVALTVAGAAIRSAPAFANGGSVSGPMMAMVGDNTNAHIDNEFIGPASGFRRMLREEFGGNGGAVQVYGRISNDQLYISSERGRNEQNTLRGR